MTFQLLNSFKGIFLKNHISDFCHPEPYTDSTAVLNYKCSLLSHFTFLNLPQFMTLETSLGAPV